VPRERGAGAGNREDAVKASAHYILAMDGMNFDTAPADTRVVVAMSGGVDSSATAALLVERGFDVVGITLQLYDHGRAVGKPGACCAGQDIHDARNVADRLGIPHYVLDYETRFKAEVIDSFAASYARGETPIPCVECNRTVKFRDLVSTARDLGAAALATGHYVRRIAGADGPELHRAADPARDQSYFLFAMTAGQLDFLRFPLGGLPKDETRAIARRFDLPVAAKPDSQDICFVPQGGYARIVEKLRPEAAEPGDIVDSHGNVLGRHDGIINFTVGQRRGLGVSGGEPLFVVAIEPGAHRVVVGPRSALGETRVRLRDVNWIAAAPTAGQALEARVKLRSTSRLLPATVASDGNGGALVTLHEPEFGVSPGQACVFYRGERMLGGGWIVRDRTGLTPAAPRALTARSKTVAA
jgi:tRNA-uridine 2-sulfurtransferase